jgi:hypothetical protein
MGKLDNNILLTTIQQFLFIRRDHTNQLINFLYVRTGIMKTKKDLPVAVILLGRALGGPSALYYGISFYCRRVNHQTQSQI